MSEARRNYIALPSISKNTLQGALMEIEGVRVFLTISGIELFHADFLVLLKALWFVIMTS